MGRARQIASAENMDRIILDSSDGTADAGDFLLLDASAAGTDDGFFINTEIGTIETIQDGFVNSSSIATDAITSTKIADLNVTGAKIETGVSLANGLTLTDGNLTVASGHGIDFSGTADGGTVGTEVFDDYEEGDWTPAIYNPSNTPTYYNQVGRYTRIGRNVYLQLFLQTNQAPTYSDANTQFLVTGAPFNLLAIGYTGSTGPVSSQTLNYTSGNNSENSGSGTGGVTLTCGITADERMSFWVTGSGGSRGYVENSGTTSGFILEANIHYITDA